METEDAVCLMTSIALIVLSIQYRRGRWLCSIAGYDVTKRESEIDIRPYAKLISSVTLWMGLLFFLGSPVLFGSFEYQPPIRVATLHLDAVDRQPVSILNELKALLEEAPQVPGTKLD